MKLAFSTLGCPDFSWNDIYSMAKDLGFDGIEIRGLGNEIFAVQAQPFTEAQLPQTVKKLSELHIEIPCLSSGCCLKKAEDADKNFEEIMQYIELATKLGTPYIRILADQEPQPNGEVDDEVVLAALQRLAPEAEKKGVTLLIETNGVYADTARLCSLCGNVVFPRISPAIIILVSKGDKILLARHARRNTDLYTCLAGFMEHGESIEKCAEREVKEETGYHCHIISYLGSIEEHKLEKNFLHISYCFLAETVGKKGSLHLTKKEKSLGFKHQWFSIDEAIEMMEKSISSCNQYGMLFTLTRERLY